jgi:hypothetical protein
MTVEYESARLTRLSWSRGFEFMPAVTVKLRFVPQRTASEVDATGGLLERIGAARAGEWFLL